MRFMILVKTTRDSEAGVMLSDECLAALARYHEQLARAGVLLDVNSLQPSAKGWRLKSCAGRLTVSDGPFAGEEIVAAYGVIDVKSKEEALEWARRFPNAGNTDVEIEVRPMLEPDGVGR